MEEVYIRYPFVEKVFSVSPLVIALGFFDGVHIGHRGVIERARQLAIKQKATLSVMTFFPHPKEVLTKNQERFRYLTPLPEKLSQFAQLGMEKAFIVEFTPEFASLSKEDFLEKFLVPLGVSGITTGFNFTFGRAAQGTPDDLRRLSAGRFEVETVSPIMLGDAPVSSTRIREALTIGKVEDAQKMLGRPYRIKGNVVPGDKRGRLLGFPTANLQLEQPYFVPRLGVYVVDVWVRELNLSALGIMNIGIRPTIDDPKPEVRWEVHLLEENVDLYEKELEIDFLHYLRPEQRFPSLQHLKAQLQQDRENAYAWHQSRENRDFKT